MKQLTVCGLAKVAIFTTELLSEHRTFGYHKCICEARNPAFWVGAVSSIPNSILSICRHG